MRSLLIISALVVGAQVSAFELDNEQVNVSPQQIEAANALPKTTVVRVSKSDPTHVEVIHLKVALKPGQKPVFKNFEKMALNSEVTGIAFDSGKELDQTSSTSSWGFGYGRGHYGGYRGGYAGYRGYAGYGYRYPAYGYRSYRPYYGYASTWAYPTYRYAGYNYAYTPYWGYQDNRYYYAYCGWGY